MMKLTTYFLAPVLWALPAMAADEASTEKKEQSTSATTSQEAEKDGDGVVKKAVKIKTIDAVGNDGVVEKGAKAKVLTK